MHEELIKIRCWNAKNRNIKREEDLTMKFKFLPLFKWYGSIRIILSNRPNEPFSTNRPLNTISQQNLYLTMNAENIFFFRKFKTENTFIFLMYIIVARVGITILRNRRHFFFWQHYTISVRSIAECVYELVVPLELIFK